MMTMATTAGLLNNLRRIGPSSSVRASSRHTRGETSFQSRDRKADAIGDAVGIEGSRYG